MTQQLKIAKMVCSSCVNTVTQAIKTVDPTATVEADPKTKIVRVETQASGTEIKEALTAVGYPPA